MKLPLSHAASMVAHVGDRDQEALVGYVDGRD
jgi:hypothetical protein